MQMAHYKNYIESRADWDFVGMYSDEGISGTNTKKLDGFNQMIEDALAGKIDLIITKSVSRFARNTVDSLQNVRKLKEHGVEIYFEKENIWTFDTRGDVLCVKMIQRLSLLYVVKPQYTRAFRDFSVWKLVDFWRCSAIFRSMEARPTGRGVKAFDTPENSQKEKCESLGSYTGTGFTSSFASFDFDTLMGDQEVLKVMLIRLYMPRYSGKGRVFHVVACEAEKEVYIRPYVSFEEGS